MIYDFAKYGLASKSKVDSFNGIQTYRGRMTTICPIRDDFVVEISEPTEIVYVISITIIGILTILLSFLLLFLIIARSPKMTRENRIGLACLQVSLLDCDYTKWYLYRDVFYSSLFTIAACFKLCQLFPSSQGIVWEYYADLCEWTFTYSL